MPTLAPLVRRLFLRLLAASIGTVRDTGTDEEGDGNTEADTP